jgi:hypothetical protein
MKRMLNLGREQPATKKRMNPIQFLDAISRIPQTVGEPVFSPHGLLGRHLPRDNHREVNTLRAGSVSREAQAEAIASPPAWNTLQVRRLFLIVYQDFGRSRTPQRNPEISQIDLGFSCLDLSYVGPFPTWIFS